MIELLLGHKHKT